MWRQRLHRTYPSVITRMTSTIAPLLQPAFFNDAAMRLIASSNSTKSLAVTLMIALLSVSFGCSSKRHPPQCHDRHTIYNW